MLDIFFAIFAVALPFVCHAARPAFAAPVGVLPEPVLLSLPTPVIVVNAADLTLVAVNKACTDNLGGTWVVGTPLEQLFTADERVAAFLTNSRDRILPPSVAPGDHLRLNISEECPCIWKDSLGRLHSMILTLFFVEKKPQEAALLFLSADQNASIPSKSLRRCFDSFSEMFFFKDNSGRFVLCNKAFCEGCNRSQDEIMGKSVEELNLPEPFDRLLSAHDENVLESGLPFFSETVVTTSEGKTISFENQCYPDIAVDGSIRGLFGVCRDITLSKATAAALKRQGDLLQAANDAALLLFSDDEELDDLAHKVLGFIGSLTGADSVEVWRNHGNNAEGLLCTQVYLWTRERAPRYGGSYVNTVIYSAHLPGWEQELASGRSINTLTRDLSAQELRHLELHRIGAALAAPILFRSTFWGFICLGVRNTEHDWGRAEEGTLRSVGLLLAATIQRRQIQAALTESEQRFRDVTMAAGEIVWELDSQGYFSYVSERIFALTGYLPEEVRGMRWEDFAVDEAGEEMTGRMFQASVPTGSFRAFEHRVKTKEGSPLWLFTSGKLLTGPEGIAGLRGTSLDITHDKQTTENLNTTLKALEYANKELEFSAERAHALARKAESASKAKSEFLANMSHEIRTPLNAIIGLAYLVQKMHLSPKQLDYISKIHNAGVTLLGVVNDILDFSKIESGKLAIEHLPFALHTLFDNLASIVGAKAEEQGIDVAFFIERNVPLHLMGDPLRLGQVLINLVGNAVKFTEKGGISVRCHLDRIAGDCAHLRFIVRDTGIGIPEEQQSLLFQSFSQVDSSITRKYGGTGLGLVIAKNLLELAGGALSLESVQGQGTKITINIPLDIDKNVSEGQRGEDVLAGLAVTLVDPSDMQRALVLDMLKDMGCRATAFSDMGQAFASIASTDASSNLPRVLILPLSLAEQNQSENLLHLRKTMLLSNIPHVLAVAPFGYGEQPDDKMGLEDKGGADGGYRPTAIITRPVVSHRLYEVLQRLVLGPQAATETGEALEQNSLQIPYFSESRILLVEDNLINQQIAAELINETGAVVTVAENGRIALDMLESSPGIPFDLIFMDLQMPELDGISATRKIRANSRFAGLPIIAMTAHATVDERTRCLEAGMNEHIAKPIDVASLYDTMRRWLKPAYKEERKGRAANPLDDSPLPELPGIDVEEGLSRVQNDMVHYKTLLLQFRLQLAAMDSDLLSMLFSAQKPPAVEKILAKIESVRDCAQLIGAKRLLNASEALLQKLPETVAMAAASSAANLGQKDAVISFGAVAAKIWPGGEGSTGESQHYLKLLHSFFTEFTAILGMLQFVFPNPQSSPLQSQSQSSDGQSLLPSLAVLNSLLADDDAAARRMFEALEPHIKQVNVNAATAAGSAIAAFDFPTALAVLRPMEKGLRASLREEGLPE